MVDENDGVIGALLDSTESIMQARMASLPAEMIGAINEAIGEGVVVLTLSATLNPLRAVLEFKRGEDGQPHTWPLGGISEDQFIEFASAAGAVVVKAFKQVPAGARKHATKAMKNGNATCCIRIVRQCTSHRVYVDLMDATGRVENITEVRLDAALH